MEVVEELEGERSAAKREFKAKNLSKGRGDDQTVDSAAVKEEDDVSVDDAAEQDSGDASRSDAKQRGES